MGKTTHLFAVILMSLGLAACSVNAGGGSAGDPSQKQSSPKTDSSNGANNSTDNSTSDKSANSSDRSTGTSNSNNSTNNSNVNNSNNGTTANILAVNPRYITSVSHAYKYVTDESAKKELLSKISAMSNITGPCASAKGSSCGSSVPAGTVMAAYKQSYSNYAVIRETYDRDNRTKPANSFVSLVTHVTPETNKTAALNATYVGQALIARKIFPML